MPKGNQGRSQHSADHEVCEGYLLLAIRFNREHFIFLLVEFQKIVSSSVSGGDLSRG
jgi:hypothetical protein